MSRKSGMGLNVVRSWDEISRMLTKELLLLY